jgi:hypothetical protein
MYFYWWSLDISALDEWGISRDQQYRVKDCLVYFICEGQIQSIWRKHLIPPPKCIGINDLNIINGIIDCFALVRSRQVKRLAHMMTQFYIDMGEEHSAGYPD